MAGAPVVDTSIYDVDPTTSAGPRALAQALSSFALRGLPPVATGTTSSDAALVAANAADSATTPGAVHAHDSAAAVPSASRPPPRRLPCATWLASQITTRAALVNLLALHVAIMCVLFQHFFYEAYMLLSNAATPLPAPPPPLHRRQLLTWQASSGEDPSATPLDLFSSRKVVVRSIEFGLMFPTMWNLGLLLLTMCKLTLLALTKTSAARYIPFHDFLSVHLFAGKLLLAQLLAAFCLFFGHIGRLCLAFRDGTEPRDFCSGTVDDLGSASLTSEIMLTGYALLALALAVGLPALPSVRRALGLSYEAFERSHTLFILFFVLALVHTFDKAGRASASARSQTWVWLVGPITAYALDRAWRNAFVRAMPVTKFKLVKQGRRRTLTLNLRRPPQWSFEVGQYVKLRVGAVSLEEWHPFSIASSPLSDELEFCISVVEGKSNASAAEDKITPSSWTLRVFRHFEALYEARVRSPGAAAAVAVNVNAAYDQQQQQQQQQPGASEADTAVTVDVDGPYGASMGSVFTMKNLSLLAAGTGVAPNLSVLRTLGQCDAFGLDTHVGSSPVTLETTWHHSPNAGACSTPRARAKQKLLGSMRRGEFFSTRRLILLEPLQPTPAAAGAAEALPLTAATALKLLHRYLENEDRLLLFWQAMAHSTWLFSLSLALSVWNLTAAALELSWWMTGLGTEVPTPAFPSAPFTQPFFFLDVTSSIALAIFVLISVLQPATLSEAGATAAAVAAADASAGASAGADEATSCADSLRRGARAAAAAASAHAAQTLLNCGMAAMHATLLYYSFGLPRASPLMIGLLTLTRFQQALALYSTNPLFLLQGAAPAADETMSRTTFMKSVALTWATSAESFASLYEELRDVRATLVGTVHFTLRVIIHQVSDEEKAALLKMMRFDRAMIASVHFMDLDAVACLEEDSRRVINHDTSSGTAEALSLNVFVYGSEWFTNAVAEAFFQGRPLF